MTQTKKRFLIIFALIIIGLYVAQNVYNWNQHIEAEEVAYLKDMQVENLTFDGQGRLWVYGAGELKVYENGISVQVFTKKDTPVLGGELGAFAVDNRGHAWIAPRGDGAGLVVFDGRIWSTSLAFFDGTKWSTLPPFNSYGYNNNTSYGNVTTIAIDTQRRVWVGVYSNGLYVNEGDIWKNYSAENSGLNSNYVSDIVFDNQGRAWIATEEGVNIFDGKVWQTFNTENSLIIGNDIQTIAFDKQARAWIGTGDGISRQRGMSVFDGENWTSYEHGGWYNGVSKIVVDGQGRAWVKSKGIEVFDRELREYYYFDINHLDAYQIATDGDGNTWLSTDNGVVIITPASPQPISYFAGVLYLFIKSGGLIYLTILLLVMWFCVALNAWRSIGFSLIGFPIYLVHIYFLLDSGFLDLSPTTLRYFHSFFLFENPGTIGTIAGLIGGFADTLIARSGKTKSTRWGLIGLVIGSGLSFCYLVFMLVQQ